MTMTEEQEDAGLKCGNCPCCLADNWERGMLCPVIGYNCCAEDECCCSPEDFDKAIESLQEAQRRV